MISTLRKRHQTIVSNKKRRYSSRTRKRRTSKRGRCALIISVAAFFILLCCVIVSFIVRNNRDNTVQAQKILPKLSIQTKLIQKNKYSRPGIALKKVKGVSFTIRQIRERMQKTTEIILIIFQNLMPENKRRLMPAAIL